MAMADSTDKIQALMDEVYSAWQKEENKGKGKWDVLDGFSEAHQIAVVFGNFNYQVENGGIEQWIYNGYFQDDAEKLAGFLEIGAETDTRCRTILDKVYMLDKYAQETGCDRYGDFRDPYDGDDEGGFIGDIINCDEFDTWYYEHCGKDDWWETVCGFIDEAESHGLAPVGQQEHSEGDTNIKPTLQVYIENVHDERIGGFTIPLPTTAEALQPFLTGAEIKGWQDMKIWEVTSDIGGLGEAVKGTMKKSMTPDTLDELNYFAARIGGLSENQRDIFAAVIASGWRDGTIKDTINIIENLDNFDLQPAFSEEQYGDFLLDTQKDETSGVFRRFEDSADPDEKAFADYVLRLEAYINPKDYGRGTAEEEGGVFTKYGYITADESPYKGVYRGTDDVPDDYRLFSQPGERAESLVKAENINVAAALIKISAVSGDYMRGAPAEILKEISGGKDRDYLLTVNTNGIHFYPALDAYKRGGGPAGVIASLTGEPGTRFFALRLNETGSAQSGGLLEVNRDALHANAIRHHITPDWMEAEMADGSKSSFTIWDWSNMDSTERSQVVVCEPKYSTDDINKVQRRFNDFRNECATAADEVTEPELLESLNKAYMAAAHNSLADMIRIENEAAREILARGDADVYRLTQSGSEKLSQIDAAKPLCFKENSELAIKREDISGLDKWAERTADKLLRQQERGERDKSQTKGDQLL